MNSNCCNCEYHRIIYEDDVTEDGCFCVNEDAEKYHADNCFDCKGCPFYKDITEEG